MLELAHINALICRTSVLVTAACALVAAILVVWRTPRLGRVAVRLALPVAVLGFVVRLLTPWGPHINSGRDLRYLDEVIYGPSYPHTHLMAAVLWPVRQLDDPLVGLELGQIGLGAASAGLVALLTYGLCRRQLPAMMAGLLAATLVVLARVDASPNAMVASRFVLLLTSLLVLGHLRTGSRWCLLGVCAGAVATSYGRLEGGLLAGLLFVWLIAGSIDAQPGGPARSDREASLRALGALLLLTVLAALLDRLLLPVMAAAVIALLWRRRAGFPIARPILATGMLAALALVPRVQELVMMDRETSSRFPMQLLGWFGKSNILFFDPALCTPLVLLLIAVGLWAHRRTEPDTMRFLACVAIPVWAFAMLFQGNASARLKLQGTGILLLLPIAGLGAQRVVVWLGKRWQHPSLAWSALGALVLASIGLFGFGALRSATSLEQEYRFVRSLRERLPNRTTIHALPRAEEKSVLEIPSILQARGGFRVALLEPSPAIQLPADALVWLGAGCRRFRGGEPLPEVGRSLEESLLDHPRWSFGQVLARYIWDKDAILQQRFDELAVGERPECAALRQRHGLTPYDVTVVHRSPLDGQYLPARVPIGLYRVTR